MPGIKKPGSPGLFMREQDSEEKENLETTNSETEKIDEYKSSLADIAPTILKLVGLDKPSEMTGKSIF